METEHKIRVSFEANISGIVYPVDLIIGECPFGSVTHANIESVVRQIKRSLKEKTPSIEDITIHTKDTIDGDEWFIIEEEE